jgi:chromosome segregation ATPase
MSKNLIIGVLAVMLVLGSLWGQVGNKTQKAVQHELSALEMNLQKVKADAEKKAQELLARIAAQEQALKSREHQLAKARQELVKLRKGTQGLASQVSERDAAIAALTQEKNSLAAQAEDCSNQLGACKKVLAEAGNSGKQVAALQQQAQELKAALAAKEQQLAEATKKLQETREVKQVLHSTVEKKTGNTEELRSRLAQADKTIKDLKEKLAVAEAAADQTRLSREYETVRAQVIGLEKIIEEKNAALEETSRELDKYKVNMDVLLSRISELQDTMQELQEENRSLVQEVAARNKEIADLNEQLIQTPVQQ